MSRVLTRIGVCGAGAMGSGIAQVAAQNGAHVTLFDVSADALLAAEKRIAASVDGLAAKGRLAEDEAEAIKSRIITSPDLGALSDCELVIEAIIEDAAIKADLFTRLEAILAPDAIIATNTSSLPIARLARSLATPARFVGMHFFNPPTVMKLVEVIAGPASEQAPLGAVYATAENWGKVAVRVADVPGFIVNRVARPFYAEAFTAWHEQAAAPAEIDALFRAAGFRMGPLELTDFIGQDVNFTVARSVFDSYFGYTRFRPQLQQAALVDAGWLGRKSGRGVYDYAAPVPIPADVGTRCEEPASAAGQAAAKALLASAPGEIIACGEVEVTVTCGATAMTLSGASGRSTLVFDWFEADAAGPMGFAASDDAAAGVAAGIAAALGRPLIKLADRPGLIVCRTLAQIANAAADAVFQHVADEAGIDAALRYGANYPFGPFGWLDRFGRGQVRRALTAIAQETGDPAYTPSQLMRGWQ